MTDGPARALLLSRRMVVLDFDGPVTRLLPGEEYLRVTEGALELALSRGVRPDDELTGERDHVQLLRALTQRDTAVARAVERWCTEQEVAAASRARPVPAAATFVTEFLARGAAVAVVTNNAPAAVSAVFAHGGPVLAQLPVYGREPGALDRLKPAPDMLTDATRDAGWEPADAVMIGDSASDVVAAAAAGMSCIGLSPVAARRTELLAAGAAAVVPDLATLLSAAS